MRDTVTQASTYHSYAYGIAEAQWQQPISIGGAETFGATIINLSLPGCSFSLISVPEDGDDAVAALVKRDLPPNIRPHKMRSKLCAFCCSSDGTVGMKISASALLYISSASGERLPLVAYVCTYCTYDRFSVSGSIRARYSDPFTPG